MCPFSILAFLQPTTVDKEPLFYHISWKKGESFQKREREPEGSLISFILLFLPQFQRQYPQLLLLFLHFPLPLLED